jgi:phosphoribosyl 1,2-cyclic phosphodiesterase
VKSGLWEGESGPSEGAGGRRGAGRYLSVRCWGTRGSVPAPGPFTLRYGGNTSCVEVRTSAGQSLILDAGTGIRLLGERLPLATGGDEDSPVHLFLTHFHWDHIQGIPFFSPLQNPRTRVTVHGPRQGKRSVEGLLRSQMSPVFFPLPFARLPAELSYRHVGEEAWEGVGLRVASIRVRHPSRTLGYRVEGEGVSVAYVPDNELGWVDRGSTTQMKAYDRFLDFLDGVDLLIHDAMYTDEEYRARRGWGHSSVGQTVRLARDAGVGRLWLFHHAPERTDAVVDRIVDRECRGAAAAGRGDLRIEAAREGVEVELKGETRP